MSKEKNWKEISIAAVASKSSVGFLTGDWRTYKPAHNIDKCVKCLTCAILCPEGAIRFNAELGKVEFNFDFCKGCGICANECPVKAIEMKISEDDQ